MKTSNVQELTADITITASPALSSSSTIKNTHSTPLVSNNSMPSSSSSYTNLFKSKLEEIPECPAICSNNKPDKKQLQNTPKSSNRKFSSMPDSSGSVGSPNGKQTMKQTRLDTLLFTKNLKEKLSEIPASTETATKEEDENLKQEFVQPIVPPPLLIQQQQQQQQKHDASLLDISMSSTKAELSQTSMLVNDTNETNDFNLSEMEVSKINDEPTEEIQRIVTNKPTSIDQNYKEEETDSCSLALSQPIQSETAESKVVQVVQEMTNVENVIIKPLNNNAKEKPEKWSDAETTKVIAPLVAPAAAVKTNEIANAVQTIESQKFSEVFSSTDDKTQQLTNSTPSSLSEMKTMNNQSQIAMNQQAQEPVTCSIPSLVPAVPSHHSQPHHHQHHQHFQQQQQQYQQLPPNYVNYSNNVNNNTYSNGSNSVNNFQYYSQQTSSIPSQPVYSSAPVPVAAANSQLSSYSNQQNFSYQQQLQPPLQNYIQQPYGSYTVQPIQVNQQPSAPQLSTPYPTNTYPALPTTQQQPQQQFNSYNPPSYNNLPPYQNINYYQNSCPPPHHQQQHQPLTPHQQFNSNPQYNQQFSSFYANNQAYHPSYNQYHQQPHQQFYQKSPPQNQRPPSVLSSVEMSTQITQTTTLHQTKSDPTYATLTTLQGNSPPNVASSSTAAYNSAANVFNSQTPKYQQMQPINSHYSFTNAQQQSQHQYFNNNGSYYSN